MYTYLQCMRMDLITMLILTMLTTFVISQLMGPKQVTSKVLLYCTAKPGDNIYVYMYVCSINSYLFDMTFVFTTYAHFKVKVQFIAHMTCN